MSGRNAKNVRPKIVPPEGGWPTKAKTVTVTPLESPVVRTPVVLDVDQDDIRRRRLVWRFADVDKQGPWPPAQIGDLALGNLLEKMAAYESMTIGEIFRVDSEHGKKYATESLPPRSMKRLQELQKDDETEVARLRCGGKPRLYGILREHVFHVLWWDAEHEVFPSKKRNT